MIRRNSRLRREYIYRKNQELLETAKEEKKEKLKRALEEGKAIPTELRAEERELRHAIALENASSVSSSSTLANSHDTSVDDEYARAGIEDPRILLTTCRNPSSRLQQFAKELKLVFPNCERMNRGHYVIKDIVNACRRNEFSDLVIVHEHRGEPDGLIISHMPYGPTVYFALMNTVLRHDVEESEHMPQAFPHLIFDNFSTRLGKRVMNALKFLFPVPKEDSKRVVTFSNEDDFISFRHHVYQRQGSEILLKELGPRFELRVFQIRLGTVDQEEAENEWVLRPYMNTASKKKHL